MKTAWLCLAIGTTGIACGSSTKTPPPTPDARGALFNPKPECMGASVVPFMGTSPQVISKLAIGSLTDGFDLDGDGKPDNKLSAISNLAASPINNSFSDYSIVIPMEFFDAPAATPDTCVKFAIYLGAYVKDNDGDGSKPYVAGGDCNDSGSGSAIHPGAAEIVGDLIDNNCDGRADEVGSANSTDTVDHDGDGFSMAQGDCDDTNPNVHPGAVEICGNGIDEDCDGVADRSVDGSGNVTACSPYGGSADIPLDPLSFDGSGDPAITYKDGSFAIGSDGTTLQLTAGPDLFSVDIPISNSITLNLKLTGAQIRADVVSTPDGFVLKNGHLGGVIDAHTADTIRGLTVAQIGLTADDSLLDALFGGPGTLAALLALPAAGSGVQATYKGCRTPDIDVDGDGLEAFCDSNPDDSTNTVDICIDGDGTVVMDTGSGSDTVQCTTATLPDGKLRFVDGVSVELNFETSSVHSLIKP